MLVDVLVLDSAAPAAMCAGLLSPPFADPCAPAPYPTAGIEASVPASILVVSSSGSAAGVAPPRAWWQWATAQSAL